jgi:hypothetical protein
LFKSNLHENTEITGLTEESNIVILQGDPGSYVVIQTNHRVSLYEQKEKRDKSMNLTGEPVLELVT